MPWWAWLLVATVAVYALGILGLVVAGRREDAKAVARFVPDCAVLFQRLLADPRVPRSRKSLLGAVLAYLAMPIDIVPDFLPVIGQLDDAIVVGLVLRLFVRRTGADIVRELWPGPERSLEVLLRASGV
jgi:uncharacterized membrane protein YkvA (DUF1232 family)